MFLGIPYRFPMLFTIWELFDRSRFWSCFWPSIGEVGWSLILPRSLFAAFSFTAIATRATAAGSKSRFRPGRADAPTIPSSAYRVVININPWKALLFAAEACIAPWFLVKYRTAAAWPGDGLSLPGSASFGRSFLALPPKGNCDCYAGLSGRLGSGEFYPRGLMTSLSDGF